MNLAHSFFLVCSAILYVVPVLVIFACVVGVHEFGHFVVARWRGVTVKVYSFGMGRELVGLTDRRGTRWRVSAIPLGGYVRFDGDADGASVTSGGDAARLQPEQRRTTLSGQPIWGRAAIVAAGPIANFAFAILVFASLSYFLGETTVPPKVDRIISGSPAEQAGFQKGDFIRSVDGQPISNFAELIRAVALRPGETMIFVIEREGHEATITATPALTATDTPAGQQRIGRLGIAGASDEKDLVRTYPSPVQAIWSGVQQSANQITVTGEYLWRLGAGRMTTDQLSGPIGMVRVSHAAAALGPAALFSLAAMLSLSLGMMNLLPVPMLDGGHLLLYALEAARGQPLSPRSQEFSLRVGLSIVGALALLVTINDLLHILSA